MFSRQVMYTCPMRKIFVSPQMSMSSYSVSGTILSNGDAVNQADEVPVLMELTLETDRQQTHKEVNT